MGVGLGMGDRTIATICEEKGIDTDFFLAIVNTYITPDYFPKSHACHFDIYPTVSYMEKTARDYLDVQLPNIERHFRALCTRSGDDNNLGLLLKFFNDLKQLMTSVLTNDLENVFPGLLNGEYREEWLDMTSHESVEGQLHDLLYFFVAHLHGNYDKNLATAVATAVFSLQRDYSQNHRIRVRILLPVMRKAAEGYNR